MFKEFKGRAQDSAAAMIKAGRPNRFQVDPIISCKMWDRVQLVLANPLTLAMVVVLNGAHNGAAWKDAVMAMRNNDPLRKPIARTSGMRLLFPTQKLLRKLKVDADASVADIRAAGKSFLDAYMREFINGEQTDHTLEESLSNMENFHQLHYNPKKWGQSGYKCGCCVCFAEGVCHHAAVCTMVTDPTMKVPKEYQRGNIQMRRKRGRPAAGVYVCEERELEKREKVQLSQSFKRPTVRMLLYSVAMCWLTLAETG